MSIFYPLYFLCEQKFITFNSSDNECPNCIQRREIFLYGSVSSATQAKNDLSFDKLIKLRKKIE